ncbi:hypothetical protein KHA80_16765 [Anaerobacillus sp. HL2]|nr:hypothetical protein KHA80_16765 [Anaerobacillus sp. HL2]
MSNYKALLIIPASLIGNWQKKLEKFAPKLKYRIIHSTKDKFDQEIFSSIEKVVDAYTNKIEGI